MKAMEQADVDTAALKERFLGRLRNFLGYVRQWLSADSRVSVREFMHEVDDPFGRYLAPGLQLAIDGRMIAALIPEAGVVIAAEGRVNLVGVLDRLAILYLSGPGRFETTIAGVKSFGRDLFPQFSEEGWYWLVNSAGPDARFVDEATFRVMLTTVSDFELATRA
jgi:hypothetical protein